MSELGSDPESSRFNLAGLDVASSVQPGVHYVLRGVLGEGGMGTVYDALRVSSLGTSPVAFKVVNPEVVLATGDEATLSVRKEAVALGRINEQSPPTPYVVRLLDTGTVRATFRRCTVDLPWLALERVHGGAEGTTLHERVRLVCQQVGQAFTVERAIRVIECVGAGLEAVHREGVIHRDLKPGNVLCTGCGASEVFKISDFGIARPSGVNATFGAVLLGTPGYVAPEQCFPDLGPTGSWSDVFSFAALVFFVLTGENYFQAKALPHALALANSGERRRLLDCACLPQELAVMRASSAELDRLLAQATASDPVRRPSSALALAHALVATLRSGLRGSAGRSLPPSTVASPMAARLEWNQACLGEGSRSVRRAAWDGDGHCLALTGSGLEFWDGSSWLPCSSMVDLTSSALGVVQTYGPGCWVLAGTAGRVLAYQAGQVQLLPGAKVDVVFTGVAGDPFDLAVFVGHSAAGPPKLFAMAGGRWLRPLELPGVAAIADVARVSETRWLVCGALDDGLGFACWYDPLLWEAGDLITTRRPLIGCAAQVNGHALAVGLGGSAVRLVDGYLTDASVAALAVDLWSVAVDATGAAWAGGIGALYHQSGPGKTWESVLPGTGRGELPFTSLFADVGRVVGLTRDGSVLEGRAVTVTR